MAWTNLILRYSQLGYRISLDNIEEEQMKKLTMVDTRSGLSGSFCVRIPEHAMEDPHHIKFIEEAMQNCHKQVQKLKAVRY